MLLQGERIKLRALEPDDLELLYKWENNPELWSVSCATEPYSRYVITEYISHSDKTIYEKKQLRLMINCIKTNTTLGIIDLFDFDPFHLRAGVGILIDPQFQQKGYASEALNILIDYAFNFLNLKQLYAHIPVNNGISRALFLKNKFKNCGCLKKWLRDGDNYFDVEIHQLVK